MTTRSLTSEPLIEEIRERRIDATAEWSDILAEAKKDRMCVAGQVWDAIDPVGKQQRITSKRPYLALDELGQYINQTVNDVRANPRGIRYAPTGNGANDKGAEFYQNHTREIEYRSKASVAYSGAFDNAVTSGVGWLRVTTKREHVRTFNKDIWIEPIANPDQVLPSPNIIWPDSRDLQYLYYVEPWSKKEFQRRFPKAKVRDFSAESRTVASQWISGDSIHVAEYWKIETVRRRLVAIQKSGARPDGSPWPVQEVLVDELPNGKIPPGLKILREEDVDDPTVKSYLTNGIEILKENDWKGKHIPFVSCFGKILFVEQKGAGARRQILSMTRLARDPYMLYCYYRTCEAELIGMTPKFPYFAYEGQLSSAELVNLQKSLHEPVAVIRVKPTVEGAPPNQVLGFPARQPYEPPIQGLEIGAEAARRAIQAAMGISPLPTEAQRHNQKSGVALRQIESSGQKGSFHFTDHYDLMIERTGVIIEDLMTPTLDTARDVPIRLMNDKADIIRINDPEAEKPIFTKGDYRVTISTGPANDSQREAADDVVDGLVSNIATIAQLAGPQKALKVLAKSIKIKQLGPEGDELVEILDPPPPQGPDGKPISPEMQQLQGENQQLKQVLQQAATEKQGKVVEQQGKFAIVKMQEEHEDQRAAADREAKITVAELGAKVDRLQLFMEERDRIGLRLQATMDRIHAALESTKDRVHDVTMAHVGHQQALEAADRAVDGQLVTQAAAAAAEPPPAEGGPA